ncbi:MAG TPA: S-methyl-5'-thioadenosine phosphorylase [Candidatus Acetothermia bacterium]|nr:S-methyl-5'-thioadenosine phosphorylase [Candidatus Acetothermia bacterium]
MPNPTSSSVDGDGVRVQAGVIGGSGLYEIEGIQDVQTVSVDTPFGAPSDDLVVGTLSGVRVAFLPRHGRGHRISPSELPSRANIWALKALGATHVLSISAVGSLREELAARDVVIPNQILDRTKGVRPASFFGDGLVVHIAFAEPYCPELCDIVTRCARETGATVHQGGTMVVMEGPQFSTKAESAFHRQIGGDLIGMTALPEAKLAREAEMCYCTVAMVTDYDCWHEEEDSVTAEMVVANVRANVATAKAIVRAALPHIAAAPRRCACGTALDGAIMTDLAQVPERVLEQVGLLLGKRLEG